MVELTPKETNVLLLRYQGLKIAEIAEKLEVSPSDISQTLSRIENKLVSVADTLSLLHKIGVIKVDSEIILTPKGESILKGWAQTTASRMQALIKELNFPKTSSQSYIALNKSSENLGTFGYSRSSNKSEPQLDREEASYNLSRHTEVIELDHAKNSVSTSPIDKSKAQWKCYIT